MSDEAPPEALAPWLDALVAEERARGSLPGGTSDAVAERLAQTLSLPSDWAGELTAPSGSAPEVAPAHASDSTVAAGAEALTSAAPGTLLRASAAPGVLLRAWPALAAGFGLGALAGVAVTLAVVRSDVSPVAPLPAPVHTAAQAAATTAPAPLPEAVPVAPPPLAQPASEPASSTPRAAGALRGAAAAPRSLRRGGRGVGEPAGSTPTVDRQLREERRLLELARTAFERGRSVDAEAALREHASRFPRGRLREERDSLRVPVLVALERYDEARRAAAAFRARYPGSLFSPLVEQALRSIP